MCLWEIYRCPASSYVSRMDLQFNSVSLTHCKPMAKTDTKIYKEWQHWWDSIEIHAAPVLQKKVFCLWSFQYSTFHWCYICWLLKKRKKERMIQGNKVPATPPVEGCITYSAWMNLYWINLVRSENPISSWDLKMF